MRVRGQNFFVFAGAPFQVSFRLALAKIDSQPPIVFSKARAYEQHGRQGRQVPSHQRGGTIKGHQESQDLLPRALTPAVRPKLLELLLENTQFG